ncbi:hypothetical protein CK203_005678 [Vitis vinifera]|uniref:Retrovirus-related Pol polyprotein from transposon TNT 1-94 n=1 Tax=Vitis vinifera TaxID=29760 RepID=A0A438K423_VITVI|nr:hypothetical protein CK203_005678 [Vitis vinifera]
MPPTHPSCFLPSGPFGRSATEKTFPRRFGNLEARFGANKVLVMSFSFRFASSISTNVNNIPVLNGTNFKKWKERVMIVLGCMDLDYALKEDRLANLTNASTAKQRATVEKWE